MFETHRGGQAEIFAMHFDGTGKANLTQHPADDRQPAVSPDGSAIAFVSDRAGNTDIFWMSFDGNGQKNLTNHPASDTQPAFSPDGKKIAFTSDFDGDLDVYVKNLNTGAIKKLTQGPAADHQPVFSPDGATIAFTTNRGGDPDIYLMDAADGSGQTPVVGGPSGDSHPAFSPDGERLVFTSDRDGNNDIYSLRLDGIGGSVNLTNHPASDSQPVLSPELGLRLVFTTNRDGDHDLFHMRAEPGALQADLINDPEDRPRSDSSADWQSLPPYPPSGSPIEHVVILFQENHSFDNVLGKLCLETDPPRCDGTTRGQLSDGSYIDLPPATDIVPGVPHGYHTQVTAVNGGLMNGWDRIGNCSEDKAYRCFQQYEPHQVPNYSALARRFVISDRTFQLDLAGSWGAHAVLAAAHLDGFYTGLHTKEIKPRPAGGWGCDSGVVGGWRPTPWGPFDRFPTCIPKPDGTGPFRPSEVPWVPTIMDRLDAASLSWRLYAPSADEGGYGWSICPTFADCLYTDQIRNWVDRDQFVHDAEAGELANLSILIPGKGGSQHNNASMLEGDNWIGRNVEAVMNGPDWSSTAIFITYDDCGCFYDHEPPPPDLGIRMPMVIVSPWARPGYTDSHVASFDSLLAFTERTFGLAPLSPWDADSYPYTHSFDFEQAPLEPVKMTWSPVPPWSIRWMRENPPDPDDPT